MSDESVGEGFPHDVDETEATGRGLASADGLTVRVVYKTRFSSSELSKQAILVVSAARKF